MSSSPRLSEALVAEQSAVWRTWLPHPFTAGVADGSLPQAVFLRWLAQDYRFVSEGLGFLGVLLSRAPAAQRDLLAQAIGAWNTELGLFRDAARAAGADLDAPPLFVTRAYGDFLLATAHHEPFETAWAVLYGVERSYHDAWRWAREHAAADGPYAPWIDNWGSDAFGGFVAALGTTLDALATGLDATALAGLRARFAHTALLEHHFWEMAWHGERFAVPG